MCNLLEVAQGSCMRPLSARSKWYERKFSSYARCPFLTLSVPLPLGVGSDYTLKCSRLRVKFVHVCKIVMRDYKENKVPSHGKDKSIELYTRLNGSLHRGRETLAKLNARTSSFYKS